MWNTAFPTYMPITSGHSSTRLEFEAPLTTEGVGRWMTESVRRWLAERNTTPIFLDPFFTDTKDNQFCLEQDDDMDTSESDNSLPEFLDTFEVKGGD